MIKLCPLLITREEVKAMLIGQGDYMVQNMRPCIKSKCIAYCKGWCSRFKNAVEIDDSEVQE